MEKISGEAINLDIGGLIHQDGSFLEHAVKLMPRRQLWKKHQYTISSIQRILEYVRKRVVYIQEREHKHILKTHIHKYA